MRISEVRLLTEESEIRPNRHTAKAMLVMSMVALLVLGLNDLGLFRIDKTMMRISTALTLALLFPPELMVMSSRLAAKRWMKYLMLTALTLATLLIQITQTFHVTLLLMVPIMAAAQYPSRRVCIFAVTGSILVTILAPVLSHLLHTWPADYLQYLVSLARSVNVAAEPVGEPWNSAVVLRGIVLYLIFPRLLCLIFFSFTARAVTKGAEERLQSQVQVLHMGESDPLTDLLNRRRFDQDSLHFPEQCHSTASCVFVDANGLRELNNHQGHAAGDELLKCVARHMQELFGTEYTYRIGGDEFVAFTADLDAAQLQDRLDQLRTAVEAEGYFISIGHELSSVPCSMAPLLRAAELKMYDAKRAFYQDSAHDRRRRSREQEDSKA